MSVITTADEHRDEAQEHLSQAYKNLIGCADSWGWEEYNKDYQDNVLESLGEIMKIMRKL